MKPPLIGIAVNEVSGDQLAAALIRAMKRKRPEIRFAGMTGPLMEAEGCVSLEKMDPVMGLSEVLRHLPHLLGVRKRLFRHFRDNPPDLFIGVDAPDFNLRLETRLKASGTKTAHLVCPTVWAWRQGRAEKFKDAVDLMLCIFEFEIDFLRRYQVNAAYVGHPMADEVPLQPLAAEAQRRLLGMDAQRSTIAILPGSRMSEVGRLTDDFLATARWCLTKRPELQFVVPLVNSQVRQYFEQRLKELAPNLPVILLDRQPREAIQAAEVVLVASGTATLECLLHKRPMVVAYRLSSLTYGVIRVFNLLKVPHVAMANLLSEEPLAPEFLQHDCRPEKLGEALLGFIDSPERRDAIQTAYQQIHEKMRCDSADKAADVVLELINRA
ncbi:MAG: lipid-A-disaccharide synthase [Gammaproteobacteria bacterium]|nr:lipid-A-disaccharide synthase [Gammaproteobacteria bacterium]